MSRGKIGAISSPDTILRCCAGGFVLLLPGKIRLPEVPAGSDLVVVHVQQAQALSYEAVNAAK